MPEAVGRPAPLFVFPNHGDHDYALAALDDASVAFALARLPDLPDPMLRQQTWSALWDMVRDGQLPRRATSSLPSSGSRPASRTPRCSPRSSTAPTPR